MIRIVLNCGEFFEARARYVWETFFRYYRPADQVRIERYGAAETYAAAGNIYVYCGPEEQADRFPPAGLALIQKQKNIDRIQHRMPPRQMGDPLSVFPALSPACLEQNTSKDSRGITCRSEELATCFILLSAYEEAVSGEDQRDKFGRFKYDGSLIDRLQLADMPVVNHIFDAIAGQLSELGAAIERAPFPGGKRFVLVPSHDIDRLSFYASGGVPAKIRGFLAESIKYRNPVEALSFLEGLFANPHDTFATIVKLHTVLNGRSSFFFVFSEKVRPMDPDYQVDSRVMVNSLELLARHGQEVGLHGSFSSVMDNNYGNELALAEKLVGKRITGGRIHYLHSTIQRLFETLDQTGVGYDGTVGFAETPGFRTGFGLPHLLFDHERGCPFRTLEIPLNMMDTTFFDKRYLGLDLNSAERQMRHLLDIAGDNQLCLTFLTHNDFYRRTNFRAVGRYKKLLRAAVDAGALITDYQHIYQWWRSLDESSSVLK